MYTKKKKYVKIILSKKDNSSDECLGVTLASISQYTPEEYYKAYLTLLHLDIKDNELFKK